MVVGEPTLMGGEFGDKDERLIARLENTQYDPSEQSDEATPVVEQAALGRVVATSTSHYGVPPPGPLQPRNTPRASFPPGSPPSQQTVMSSWGTLDKGTSSLPHLNNVAGCADDKMPVDMD